MEPPLVCPTHVTHVSFSRWSVVKALIHPVTEAKIKIIGSTADATAQLKKDGFTSMALPPTLAGTNPGLPAWELLKMLQGDA